MHERTLRIAFAAAAAMLVAAACAPAQPEQCSSDLTKDCTTSGGSNSSSSSSSSSSSTSSGDGGSFGEGGTSSGDGGTTSSSGDGGTTSSSSGGAGAFAGAPAYVQGTSLINSKGGVHNTNNAARGLACLQCHTQGGQASNLQFLFGGTVYTDVAGTVAAGPGVEVRVLDGANKAVSVYTDAYGNFAVQNGANPPVFPLKVGVRNASTAVNMVALAANGNCASANCHSGNPTARIHIP